MTLVLAHRGASAAAPENTLAAFHLAVAMGADGVELDVRRTADRCLAVHHDAHLPDGRAIVDLAAGELPPHVPMLDDALDACAGLRLVNVELKDLPGEPGHRTDHPLAVGVVERIAARNLHERVIVSSFDLRAVDHVRALDRDVPTAFLAVVAPGTATKLIRRCVAGGHGAFHPHHRGVDARLVARCHEVGLAVNTWTVDAPRRIAKLAAMGVDGIVTNEPDVALAELGRAAPGRPRPDAGS
jgi:glycerophosphoryl diester phosphodiesterase